MILPVVVMGSSFTNSISRGYSWAASRVFTKFWISSWSAWLGAELRLQNDEGLYNFPANRIRTADHGGHGYALMLDQTVFDLRRPDSIPGAGDQVVLPAHEPEIPVLVLFGQISG